MKNAFCRTVLALVAACASTEPSAESGHVEANVRTSFSPQVHEPSLHEHDFIHPLAAVVGAVEVGDEVFVAPGAARGSAEDR